MATASKAKNLVIVMSLVGATLLAFNRWVLPRLLDLRPISDGAHTYLASDPRLRTVVWSAPTPLPGELESAQREAQVTLSPDGRWVVFVAGEAGEDRELLIAEFESGRALRPRPITELSSAADEIAPAFAEDALYFASDRAGGAGGFDLYMAPWDGAGFGAPRPLEGGVNTAADELDPAPSAGALVFSSNREQGFDLFIARGFAANGVRTVEELAAANSPFDEREPFVTSDGRALYFASNRARGGGDFDVWRSVRERDGWLPAEPLAGFDTRASERSPRVSPDGFALYFDAPDELQSELRHSRSIELFRGAEPARGWADLLLMAALLLLALVAALSKRWEELDLLYKCLLVSVLLHILLMLLLRSVAPEADAWPAERQREPTFRVRLEQPRERTRALVERGGTLESEREARLASDEPLRADLEREAETRDELGARAPLARAAAPSNAGPAPSPARLERDDEERVANGPALAQPREARELRAAGESESALAVPRSTALERSAPAVDAPVVARVEREVEVRDEPDTVVLTRSAREPGRDMPAPQFTGAPIEPDATSDARTAGPELALDSSARPQRSAEQLETPLESAESFRPQRSSAAASEVEHAPRRADAPGAAASSEREDAPAAASSLPVQRGAREEPRAEYAAASSAPAPSSGQAAAGPRVELPTEERTRAPTAIAEASAREAPVPAVIEARRRTELEAGPSVRESSASESGAIARSSEDLAQPPAKPLELAPRAREQALPAAPPRLDDTPYRSRFGTQKEIALREHGGSAETERAVADGLRYLASKQRRDGSWGSRGERHEKYRDVRVGKSGLALLAFLGTGHTPASNTEHSGSAERAVRWLLSTQDETTGHFGDSESYSHGIATYALAECYALTRDPRLAPAIDRAVEQILRNQFVRGDARRVGGWSYFYPDGATFDSWPRTSITAWQVMALESARLGGRAVPDAAFDAAREFLRQAWDEELGRFRYNHDPQRLSSGYATLPGSTPAALFALSLLGEELSSAQWRDALEFVNSCAPKGYRWDGEEAFVHRAQGNLYFWYYGSLALLRRGGDDWKRWNTALKEALPPAQASDGSWEPLDVYCAYAGDDDGERVYSTAMCVLALEVYYRYFTPLLKVR
ncbi:MAG: PD40 domain-containing protein [Planctomycetes bacterium]|nr:PD40 domain-containing protein [Planctomycetota bacterium]